MVLSRINTLIDDHGFELRVWQGKQGKGVWACLSPQKGILDNVVTCTTSTDEEHAFAVNYIKSSSWIPFVFSDDINDGLKKLEERLSTIDDEKRSTNSEWSNDIIDVTRYVA